MSRYISVVVFARIQAETESPPHPSNQTWDANMHLTGQTSRHDSKPMHRTRAILALLAAASFFFEAAVTHAQQVAAVSLPDAPTPQQQSATAPAPQQPETEQQKSDRERAEQQVQKAEHQRILGLLPAFEASDAQTPVPLSSSQKMRLAFRSGTDPFVFVTAALDAGLSQAQNQYPGYGQGMAGYGKRFGASFADTFDGNLWSNGILPSVLHQDPRYFRKGTGSYKRRLLYAVGSVVWCRNDNGKWGPNYSTVLGNLIAGGISNVYYPPSDRGAGLTFERGLTVTVEGSIGTLANEFWPDISRKFLHGRGNWIRDSNPPPASAPAPSPAPPPPAI